MNPTEFDIDALKERLEELQDSMSYNKTSFKMERKEKLKLKDKLQSDQKKVVIILKEKEKEVKLN